MTHDDDTRGPFPLDRRGFLATGLTAATATLPAALPSQAATPAAAREVPIRVAVNGTPHSLTVDPRTSTLDLLRERLGLTGAKKGCDHGQCGACTVHLDGRRVVACLTPAVQLHARELRTIEGIAGPGGALHPMQEAFVKHDALQCGYCTPGQVMAAIACVQEGNAGSPERIRESMSGNLCRCGAYAGILAAGVEVAQRMKGA